MIKVALHTGYSNSNYFRRVFKKYRKWLLKSKLKEETRLSHI
ncbi:MAG: hypothetical protein ACLTQG_30685 [Hungatella sp.]